MRDNTHQFPVRCTDFIIRIGIETYCPVKRLCQRRILLLPVKVIGKPSPKPFRRLPVDMLLGKIQIDYLLNYFLRIIAHKRSRTNRPANLASNNNTI